MVWSSCINSFNEGASPETVLLSRLDVEVEGYFSLLQFLSCLWSFVYIVLDHFRHTPSASFFFNFIFEITKLSFHLYILYLYKEQTIISYG